MPFYGPRQSAISRCAIVADDVDDDGVVEFTARGGGIDQPICASVYSNIR